MSVAKGNVIVFPQSKADARRASEAVQRLLGPALSSQVEESDDKYKLVLKFDRAMVDDQFDPHDLAVCCWEAVDDYVWVGVFLTTEEEKYDERFTYAEYREWKDE